MLIAGLAGGLTLINSPALRARFRVHPVES